jgi:hypothetical protein
MNTVKLYETIKPENNRRRLDWLAAQIFLNSPFYKKLNNLEGEDILFSLRKLDFINPDGLFWLILIAEQIKRNKNYLWLELPTNNLQLEDIKRLNFLSVASKFFSITNSFELDEISQKVKVRQLGFFNIDSNTLRRLLLELNRQLLTRNFVRELGISETGLITFEIIPPIFDILKEGSKNIVQHSSREELTGSGYLVIGRVRREWIRICIGDTGRGFMSSLNEKGFKVTDDFQSIKAALVYRFFQKKEGLKGEGLFRVVQSISQLNGVIQLRSCRGRAFLDLRHHILREDDETKDFILANLKGENSHTLFPGVQILIDLKRF